MRVRARGKLRIRLSLKARASGARKSAYAAPIDAVIALQMAAERAER